MHKLKLKKLTKGEIILRENIRNIKGAGVNSGILITYADALNAVNEALSKNTNH